MFSINRFATRVAANVQRLPQFARALSTAKTDHKIVRFQGIDGEEHFGVFTDVSESACYIAKKGANGKLSISDEKIQVEVVLPPVDPPAIYCVALNFADHAAEVKLDISKYPVMFSKPITSLTGHNCAIVLPEVAKNEVDYEAELGVIIGRECKNVSEERAMDYVMVSGCLFALFSLLFILLFTIEFPSIFQGYTIVNDVTARRWQGKKGGGQYLRAKGFDTFLPVGPYVVPKSQVPDPHNLTIRTMVNGEIVQDSNTSNMIWTIPQLVSFISQGTTLLPGTLICTGTPAGVGYVKNKYLQKGDQISIFIEKVGNLHNYVAEDVGGGLVEQ